MFEYIGLDHVVLRARNANALVAFYRDVLGCPVERVLEVGLTQLRAGAALIDIVDASSRMGQAGGTPPSTAAGGPNMDHFCLRISPFDPARIQAHLDSHGVPHHFAERVYGAEGFGASIYLTDPEGNRVELKGPATEPAQPTAPPAS